MLRRTTVCLGIVLLASTAAPAVSSAAGFDLDAYELVDLTHPFNSETIYWPAPPAEFQLERLAYGMTEKGYFYVAHAFAAPEHGGTHLDAAHRRPVDPLHLSIHDHRLFHPKDPHHQASRHWLEQYVASGDLLVAPMLFLAEVAGAISRGTGEPDLARRAVEEWPQHRVRDPFVEAALVGLAK